jgi:hypothetical protein
MGGDAGGDASRRRIALGGELDGRFFFRPRLKPFVVARARRSSLSRRSESTGKWILCRKRGALLARFAAAPRERSRCS